jgi:hypothetical protein
MGHNFTNVGDLSNEHVAQNGDCQDQANTHYVKDRFLHSLFQPCVQFSPRALAPHSKM